MTVLSSGLKQDTRKHSAKSMEGWLFGSFGKTEGQVKQDMWRAVLNKTNDPDLDAVQLHPPAGQRSHFTSKFRKHSKNKCKVPEKSLLPMIQCSQMRKRCIDR